jgi:hypothetical protein
MKRNLQFHKLLSRWWDEFQWSVVGLFALLAMGLGFIGFTKHFSALGEARSGWDLFYLTLQLFTLESGSVSGPVSWELEVARLLAPAVVAYTAAKALMAIFHEQIHMFRIRFIAGHVVICGLGRKGLLLARSFHHQGYRIIVIDQDLENSEIESCKELGAIILIGNATDRELLRKARVQEARYLFSVCGSDGVNAEVAVHARNLLRDQKRNPLVSFIHIADLDLRNLLREKEITTQQDDAIRLEFFNIFESGAKALLNDHPAFTLDSEGKKEPARLLIVGLGEMGKSLVVQAARLWQMTRAETEARLAITLVDKTASQIKESLLLDHPQLEKICDLDPYDIVVESPEFQKAAFLFGSRKQSDVTAIYVCLDDDARGLSAALSLLHRVRGRHIPIIVRMTRDAGLASLLKGEDGSGEGFENLYGFGLLDRTCTPDLLLGGTHALLARAIHEDYVYNQRKKGQTSQTNRSMAPRDQLPEHLKESNRRQADHIGVKLKRVNCGLAPLNDWDTPLHTFTPEEVERLAEMEHERWVAERLGDGWTPGKRNPDQKTSPYLVPWKGLSEEIREIDREAVRGIPSFLAKAGFRIYRLTKDESIRETNR